MSWYVPPEIERSAVDAVAIWRLLGDWTRDLPLEQRHEAKAALNRDVTEPIVLDVADIKFLDSWGEETICDFLQRIHEEYGRASWVLDATRSAAYEGIHRALQRRKLSVPHFADRTGAIAALRGAS